jgi:uncharacterized delta-60 repeat protein
MAEHVKGRRATMTRLIAFATSLMITAGLLAAAFLLLLGPVPPAFAAAGDLDTTFGGDGKVTTPFKEGGAWALALQDDGKIVVAGAPGYGGSDSAFGLIRYNTDGTLDATFGGDGKVTTDFTRFGDFAYAVALQPDGKIVAAGGAGGRRAEFALARYNADGTLDTTFSGEGMVTTDFPHHGAFVDGVAIQADGKIVAAGVSGLSGTNPQFALARYNADGTPDTTFSGNGRVVTGFTPNHDEATGIAIQADGEIVAAGVSGLGDSSDFALARYNPDGTLDTSFGGDGKVTTDFSHKPDVGSALAIQHDGEIVVAGSTRKGVLSFALARYHTDGTLDTSFGGDGKVITDFTSSVDEAHGIAFQADGKIVAEGLANGERNGKFALARYNADGTLDTSFGGDGKVTTDLTPQLDEAWGVAIQADGGIVTAGVSGVFGATTDVAVTRYLPA